VKHAVKAQQLGADIIIVQGGEGGGHTGTTPTSLLVSACVDAVDVPIVAAGGFRDGRGLIAALAFGAEGVAMGTRFLMTAESPLPPVSFERYQRAGLADIVVSTALDGMPQRMVANELLEKLEKAGPLRKLWLAIQSARALQAETGATIPQLLKSGLAMRRNQGLSLWQTIMAANAPILARVGVADGDPVNGYLASGTVAGVIDDRPSCDELVRRIVEEAEQTLKRLAL
jgi:NAD(P)H-dependent flavin oxidoreductase YrpB (nitropropane dioxygenase family)